jgi:hypothetical protein
MHNINIHNIDNNPYGMTVDKLEGLVARLRAMKVVTGLCRTEKETLDEASDILENLGAALLIKGDMAVQLNALLIKGE